MARTNSSLLAKIQISSIWAYQDFVDIEEAVVAALERGTNAEKPRRCHHTTRTRRAWRLSLRLTNWRIRASEAAVSAVSALEKNADNKINNRIRAISPVRDSHIIDSSPDSHAGFARQSDVQQRPCQSFQPE